MVSGKSGVVGVVDREQIEAVHVSLRAGKSLQRRDR